MKKTKKTKKKKKRRKEKKKKMRKGVGHWISTSCQPHGVIS